MTGGSKLVIHGGAGNIKNLSKEEEEKYKEGLRGSLLDGQRVLASEDDAVASVVAAVMALEDNDLFNAGKGAVFTTAGTNELEASIMVTDGKSKRVCSVGLVNHIKNPVEFVHRLLDYSDDSHVMLSGKAAEKLAEGFGCEMVSPEYYFTQKRWDQHRRGLEKQHSIEEAEYLPKGTVGAVAMDSKGVIACATSTGGLTNKRPGRIGDTPQAGAGFWAEKFSQSKPFLNRLFSLFSKKETTAIGLSGTGNGDGFIRHAVCHSITSRVKLTNENLRKAADRVVSSLSTEAGVIGIQSNGQISFAMNCDMNRGLIGSNGKPKVAIYKNSTLH